MDFGVWVRGPPPTPPPVVRETARCTTTTLRWQHNLELKIKLAYTGQLHSLRQGHGGDATCRDPEQQQQRYETPPLQLHRVGSARFRENGATDLLGSHPVSVVVGQGKRNDRKIGRKREGAKENRVQWTLWTHGLRGPMNLRPRAWAHRPRAIGPRRMGQSHGLSSMGPGL